MKVFIVEDEKNNLLLLKNTLAQFEGLDIVGEADNVEDAARNILLTLPDVILMDIEIRGGTGFDVLELLGEYKCEVIFTTAYSNYAIRAIKHRALDYILKPVTKNELDIAINKCRNRISEKKLLYESKNSLHLKRFHVKTHTENISILISDIKYFMAQGSYTICAAQTGDKFLSKKIGLIESMLPKELFFRCHHSYIINIEHILEIEMERSPSITCKDGKIIPVSKRKKKEFLAFLQNK